MPVGASDNETRFHGPTAQRGSEGAVASDIERLEAAKVGVGAISRHLCNAYRRGKCLLHIPGLRGGLRAGVSQVNLSTMMNEEQLRQIARDVFPDWSRPPRIVVEQIGELVRRWPVEGFARETLPDQQRRLVWIDGHVIGQLDYIADAAEEQNLDALIRPLSQVTGVAVDLCGSADTFGQRTYRRGVVVRFASGTPIDVDTSQHTNDSLRGHADRFIDRVLDALAGASAGGPQ